MQNEAGFVPYTQESLSLVEQSETVTWAFVEPTSSSIYEGDFTHTMVPGVRSLYDSSFIALTHQSGKIWESVFIASSATGHSGHSITLWGKAGAKGQIQVKTVSETEWYSVVKSKVGKGEYQVVSYIGRSAGMAKGHEFIRDIWNDPTIRKCLPVGFAVQQAGALTSAFTEEGLGQRIAAGLLRMKPIAHFFGKMVMKGHLPATDFEQNVKLDDTQLGIMTTLMEAQQHFIDNPGDTFNLKEIAEEDKEAIQANREAEYSGWGAFC